ncbi:MAG: hypothetical protein ACLGSD_02485 [Acidobacteriota bacterium]
MSNVVSIAAPQSRFPSYIPALAKAATVLSAIVSLGCTFWVGQHNRSVLLAALFALWVLSPFAGLLWARRFAYWYQFAAQAMVYGLIFLVSIGSAVFYLAAAFGPRWKHPALPFLAGPLVSWLLIGLVLVVVRLSFGRRFNGHRRAA